MEGAPLYSVKWYRGNLEFYRFSPGEKPESKIFPYPGIHVDLSRSNSTVVVLQNVGFNLSGNFSCEVTVEAQPVFTRTVYQQMLVVALPNHPPIIDTDRDHYEPGDELHANCTSSPSKPEATLSFFINESPVRVPEVRQNRIMQNSLLVSSLSVSTTLFPMHYNNGQLVLDCTAHITGTHYRNTTRVVLGSRTREPVPERVTSPGASSRLAMSIHLLLLILCCHIAR